jgi:hypothetical protein
VDGRRERRISEPATRTLNLLVWLNLFVAVTPWNSWDVTPTAISSRDQSNAKYSHQVNQRLSAPHLLAALVYSPGMIKRNIVSVVVIEKAIW